MYGKEREGVREGRREEEKRRERAQLYLLFILAPIPIVIRHS